MLGGRGPEYPRVRFLAHPQRDARLEHGVDVEVVTVELPLQADGPTDPHAADQPPDPVAQDVRAVERRFHQAGVAGSSRNLTDRGPFRALDAVGAIPFRIFRDHDAALVRRRGPGATEAAFVLLKIGTMQVLVRLVALLEASRIDGKIEHFRRRGRVVAKIPQPETVIAIERLDDVGFGVELDAHLAKIVAEQHANLAADGGVFEPCQPGLEHRAPFADEAVIVGVTWIEQGSRQPCQQARRGRHAGGNCDMVGRP